MGGCEILGSADADLAAVTAAMSAASLRRINVRVLTTLPPATVATMCIVDHPDRAVEVVAIAPDAPTEPPAADTLTIVVGTPDEHKKYPAAQHVPVAGTPQHITENIRSILAAEATRALFWENRP